MSNTASMSHDDLVVCACEKQEYRARDAIDAAHFRGQLDSLWQDFQRRVAAEKAADEQNIELDEIAIDSAAKTCRYDHELITAEETEKWQASRGRKLEDFNEYCARQYSGNDCTQ